MNCKFTRIRLKYNKSDTADFTDLYGDCLLFDFTDNHRSGL